MDNIKKSFQELKWYEYLMGAVMIFIAARAMVTGFMTGAADGNPPWLTVINFISAVCGVSCIFFTCFLVHMGNGAAGNIVLHTHEFYLVVFLGTAQRPGNYPEDKKQKAYHALEQRMCGGCRGKRPDLSCCPCENRRRGCMV